MKKLHILTVGKLRIPHWADAAHHYAGRLNRAFKLTERQVKDATDGSPMERNRQEGERLLAALTPEYYPICLDERGKHFTSPEFAAWLLALYDRGERTPCFIVGGAFGLDERVRASASALISLGKMTLPHELARVVLLEQLYRAEQIWRKSPYHH